MKWKNKTTLPVSSHVIPTVLYSSWHIRTLTGEPTLDEQAKLLIAALDLGSAIGSPGYRIINVSNTTSRISRRSIAAICGTPSSEICSKWHY